MSRFTFFITALFMALFLSCSVLVIGSDLTSVNEKQYLANNTNTDMIGLMPSIPDSILNKLNPAVRNIAGNITWYGQSAIKIVFENKVIYIDPYLIVDDIPADIILITHEHHDHLSIDDINKIAISKTRIYAPRDCCKKLENAGYFNLSEVKPGDKIDLLDDISVEVVPAYNMQKTKFHPKEKQWVGYIIDMGGIKLYHPGDTERIPEMKSIKCNIAFMPLGQTYTMNSVMEAVDAILDIQPDLAIPFHYGIYEGTKEDAQKFKELLEGKVDVLILDKIE